jgi:hypothetical protein
MKTPVHIKVALMTVLLFVAVSSLLLYCGNNQQAKQPVDEKTAGVDTLASNTGLTVEDIIAFDLKWAKNEYESRLDSDIFRSYRLPPPDCEGCSDLERLLVYEKLSDYKEWGTSPLVTALPDKYLYTPLPANIKGAENLAKSDEAMTRKLKDAEAEFKRRFNQPTPWWWICSVEERIRRFEEINNAGRMYSFSSAAINRGEYKAGKIIAAYEMWFKRPFPKCYTCNLRDRVKLAEQALNVGLPYLSEEEDAELRTKMKAAHQKRFGAAIPDYWLSVAQVHYRWDSRGMGCTYHVLVTRTASGGAIARIVNECSFTGKDYDSLELSMNDWLDFINALSILGVDHAWREEERNYRNVEGYLKIFTLDNQFHFGGCCIGNIETREINVFSIDPYKKFKNVIDNMKKKIEPEYGGKRK